MKRLFKNKRKKPPVGGNKARRNQILNVDFMLFDGELVFVYQHAVQEHVGLVLAGLNGAGGFEHGREVIGAQDVIPDGLVAPGNILIGHVLRGDHHQVAVGGFKGQRQQEGPLMAQLGHLHGILHAEGVCAFLRALLDFRGLELAEFLGLLGRIAILQAAGLQADLDGGVLELSVHKDGGFRHRIVALAQDLSAAVGDIHGVALSGDHVLDLDGIPRGFPAVKLGLLGGAVVDRLHINLIVGRGVTGPGNGGVAVPVVHGVRQGDGVREGGSGRAEKRQRDQGRGKAEQHSVFHDRNLLMKLNERFVLSDFPTFPGECQSVPAAFLCFPCISPTGFL